MKFLGRYRSLLRLYYHTVIIIQYACDCSIKVNAVLEYLELATRNMVTIPYFFCAIIVNSAEPIRGEFIMFK